MAITSLILALCTTVSGGSTVAEANRLALIKYKSDQLIEMAAESYDYTNFLNLFDFERESLLKQGILNFNDEYDLIDNQHIIALQDHLFNDNSYFEFENIDSMFLKDDVPPTVISDSRFIKTTLTESLKYSPINNELIVNNLVINQQYTNILISNVTDGGGNSQGNQEETQPNGPLPIRAVNQSEVSYSVNQNFQNYIFIGIILSKEFCKSIYNIFAFFINDIFTNEAFSNIDRIVRIITHLTASTPIIPVVESIISHISSLWSSFISCFLTSGIVGVVVGIILTLFGAMCLYLLIMSVVCGYLGKGYRVGFEVYHILDWRWVDENFE